MPERWDERVCHGPITSHLSKVDEELEVQARIVIFEAQLLVTQHAPVLITVAGSLQPLHTALNLIGLFRSVTNMVWHSCEAESSVITTSAAS